ncbi:MAG: DUF3857 domain-containing protein [Parafilimonas sp.]|nr:DUF3857 domain-containing protein [Parafilimonas sp.]
MNNRLCISLALCFCVLKLNAQDYNILLIPDSLKEHANVIERFDETRIIIKSIDKAIIKHKYAYTILNEAGARHAGYFNDYSDLKDLHNIDGDLYDAFGKHLKNIKKKDIGDYSGDDEETLASDARFKAHNFYYTQYPYTIQYEDEEDYNGIFYLPVWITQPYENFSVESSRLIVETPADYNLRYKQSNYYNTPSIVHDNDKIIYTWEVKNQKAKSIEPYGPSMNDISAKVILAPTDFSIQGFTGKMDNWQDFGMFRQALLGGRDELDDVTKQKVHQLTDTVKDAKMKVIVLYKYLQNNTRYINVSFGIGGWQPHDAKYVAQKKYGDCKALSNFMGALLKEAGINSYYTVIKAGENNTSFYSDFSCNQFNHVIRCVPLQNDTMWLECTDQTLPAGYLGNFTCNRPALLITETGGKLVQTPCYNENDNIYIRKINADVSEQGDLTAKVITNYKGLEYDDMHDIFHQLNKDDIKKYLNQVFSISSYEINDFKYNETDEALPAITESIDLTANSYAHVSGKRFFIVPDIITKTDLKLDTSDKRIYDIIYPYSFKHIDTITINIPHGYSVEALPKNKTLETPFGKYVVTYSVYNDKIIFTRFSERKSNRFPATDYVAFANFCNDIYKADRSQVVLVKKDN